MFVLIIVAIILLILAIINWVQSEGFFQGLRNFFSRNAADEDQSVQHRVVTGADGVAILENDDFEDYAYDDESDYIDTADAE